MDDINAVVRWMTEGDSRGTIGTPISGTRQVAADNISEDNEDADVAAANGAAKPAEDVIDVDDISQSNVDGETRSGYQGQMKLFILWLFQEYTDNSSSLLHTECREALNAVQAKATEVGTDNSLTDLQRDAALDHIDVELFDEALSHIEKQATSIILLIWQTWR